MKIGKYEFDSKEQFEDKVSKLEEGHNHCIVKLGNIVLEPAEYNEEGEVTKEAVLSNKYHVDVAWRINDSYNEEGELVKAKHPYGWASYSVELTSNGSHSFYGLDYIKNKL